MSRLIELPPEGDHEPSVRCLEADAARQRGGRWRAGA